MSIFFIILTSLSSLSRLAIFWIFKKRASFLGNLVCAHSREPQLAVQYQIDLDKSNEAEILELNMDRQKNKENVAPSLEKSSKSAGRLKYKWTTSFLDVRHLCTDFFPHFVIFRMKTGIKVSGHFIFFFGNDLLRHNIDLEQRSMLCLRRTFPKKKLSGRTLKRESDTL